MRPSRKQEAPSKDFHISYSADRVAMRHAPLPESDLETLKLAVRMFSFAIRPAPHSEMTCTFGDLAAAARKVYSEGGDPRTAECLRVLDMAHKLTTEADFGQPAVEANKSKRGLVIVHPENGIYLGSCMGLGFWSKLDPVGQDAAVVFPTQEDARSHVESWDHTEKSAAELEQYLKNLSFVEVDIDVDGSELYASVESCKKAGLDPWYNLDFMEPASPSIH